MGTTGARFGSPALRRSLEELPVEAPPPPRRRRSLRGEVGATGARFGSAALRRSLEAQPTEAEPTEREEPREPEEPAELEETAPFSGHFEDEEVPALEWSGPLVRPYAWTRGRTSSQHDLRIETLVSLEEHGIAKAMRDTTPEQRAIVELCATTRSVAEVSALLTLPLGVVRVLLGDLIDMGVVAVTSVNAAAGPDLALMQRVLHGLRNL
ncbi:DUF742 domain-containing protein [Saccharothrix sp. NPDC042600]|uniref:DUF742 domain-containing protein n=1 Tax=Saccharothrix TaxID=2071 RepID=UPI0033C05E57|nr:hypothetical protein GCM10017745_71980 [Saccharothrix mutabilis subsp. capreolus]